VAHTPRHKSSQSRPCSAGLWKLCLWEGVCFWCPLRCSGWEILGNFIWSCNSSRGRLGTWGCWPFALGWGGRCEGGWEFAFHVFGVSLNLSQYCAINFGPERCFFAVNVSGNVPQPRTQNRVLNCGAWGRCISRESIDRGDHWISSVWPDWIFTNDIKLSWVSGGLSDWVATGSGFLSFLVFH